MLNINNFYKNVTADTPIQDILDFLFFPIKTNNKFFNRIKDNVVKGKKFKIQYDELENKINGLTKADFMPQNKKLHGMKVRLFYLENQMKKNQTSFLKIRNIMLTNFRFVINMFNHLDTLGIKNQVLEVIAKDNDLCSILPEYRIAFLEVYGADPKF